VTYLSEDVHNVKSKRPDNSRARKDLGHDPKVTLEEGVPLTLEWMESK
jgi:dTDP-glucose 4,6-dehydratase